MPADYTAVRDACIAKKKKQSGKPLSKKQIQECKKMAAIWYFKKHGKPLPKEDASDTTLRYMGIGKDSLAKDGSLQENLDKIEGDNALELFHEVDNDFVIAEIKVESVEDRIALGEIIFHAPFTKEQAGYGQGDEGFTATCDLCAHFIGMPMYGVGGSGLCHLIKGFVEWSHTCNYFTSKLVEDTELEKVKEEMKQKLKDEMNDQNP